MRPFPSSSTLRKTAPPPISHNEMTLDLPPLRSASSECDRSEGECQTLDQNLKLMQCLSSENVRSVSSPNTFGQGVWNPSTYPRTFFQRYNGRNPLSDPLEDEGATESPWSCISLFPLPEIPRFVILNLGRESSSSPSGWICRQRGRFLAFSRLRIPALPSFFVFSLARFEGAHPGARALPSAEIGRIARKTYLRNVIFVP
ncbi:hypothetical protein Hypma_005440 [Hypsizygus marmoreus]|uniref:Uncharacterized protein n=1 Tax=Hypsizygus marmoreus TaxID=39966 RepID=A0A369IZB1_HYPMA|nr:hypothetical protein Hypma_005440 [Hypsizygus marmoreus]